MPSEDRLGRRLLDIVENIDMATGFVASHDYARFVDDARTVYAVVRALEIISEASRHIPDEIRARHSQIAWREIKASGNIYRHGYDDVALDIVWDTVQHHLAPLRAVVLTEIERLGLAARLRK